jgi:hypothetical protein
MEGTKDGNYISCEEARDMNEGDDVVSSIDGIDTICYIYDSQRSAGIFLNHVSYSKRRSGLSQFTIFM